MDDSEILQRFTTKNMTKKEETKKEVKKTEKKVVTETKAEAKVEVKKTTEKTIAYDVTKAHAIEEALDIVKSISKAKFDASVEVHFRLGIDPRKGDQQVRGAVTLPHGTGRTIKIAAFVSPDNEKKAKEAGADFAGGEELIAEIKKTEKTDFQVAVAEPVMMRHLAVIAKILGTRGLMPSPKNDTVTDNPIKAIEELKKGKISFKNDDTSNAHVVIGKISFDNDKLLENYKTLLDTIRKAKPASSKGIYIKNISISSSMSPGVKVTLN